MGVLKIRGRWSIEWYGEDGKRKRKVIQDPDKPAPEGGWHEAAKKTYRDTKARLDKGEAPLFATSKKPVVEFAAKYLEVCRGTWSPGETDRVRRMFKTHLLPFFSGRRLADVRRVHVEEYIAKRTTEVARHRGTIPKKGGKIVSPATINKEVARLRHLFNKAIQWNEISRNPCQGVKRLKEPPARVAYLDGEDRARLLAVAGEFNPLLQAVVMLAMLTGARLSEILGLRWGNVDRKRRIITFTKTKSGKVRHVPINPDLFAVLTSLEPAADPASPLFPPAWNGRRISTAFRRVAKGAGLAGFRFHDLRHDFASWLTMGGVSIRGVQTLLGHADLRMTERYTHLADTILRAAVQVLPALPILPGNGNAHGVAEQVIPAPGEPVSLPTA